MAKKWGTFDPTETEDRREEMMREVIREKTEKETFALEERMQKLRESPPKQLNLFLPSTT